MVKIVVMMVIVAIKELLETHKEMGKVLGELKELEDGIDADYSEVVIDYKWLVQDCKHRLTSLKQRKGVKE